MRDDKKVFGVGLSKTATTSLSKALKILGYRTKHFPIRMLRYESGELSIDADYADRYDALTDLPIARFYKKLHRLYPDARFILTERDMEAWLDSCRRHFWPGQIFTGDNWINKLHEDLYNTIDFDREEYERAYHQHREEVLAHFGGEGDQLITMDITDGDGWGVLCGFLDEPIPEEEFPKEDCFYTEIFKVLNLQRFRDSDFSLPI